MSWRQLWPKLLTKTTFRCSCINKPRTGETMRYLRDVIRGVSIISQIAVIAPRWPSCARISSVNKCARHFPGSRPRTLAAAFSVSSVSAPIAANRRCGVFGGIVSWRGLFIDASGAFNEVVRRFAENVLDVFFVQRYVSEKHACKCNVRVKLRWRRTTRGCFLQRFLTSSRANVEA